MTELLVRDITRKDVEEHSGKLFGDRGTLAGLLSALPASARTSLLMHAAEAHAAMSNVCCLVSAPNELGAPYQEDTIAKIANARSKCADSVSVGPHPMVRIRSTSAIVTSSSSSVALASNPRKLNPT
jgi:hypothetical protein